MRGLLVLLFLLTSLELSLALQNYTSLLSSITRKRRETATCQITREEYDKMVETTEKNGVKFRKIRIQTFLEILLNAGDDSVKTHQLLLLVKKLIRRQGATTADGSHEQKKLFRIKTGLDPDLNADQVHPQGHADDDKPPGLFERFRETRVSGEPNKYHKLFEESQRNRETRPQTMEEFRNIFHPPPEGSEGVYKGARQDLKYSPIPESVRRAIENAEFQDTHPELYRKVFKGPPNIPHEVQTSYQHPDYSAFEAQRSKIVVPTVFKPPVLRGGFRNG